jgi:hypothetical protein
MAQWILKDNRKVEPCRSIRRLTPNELAISNEDEKSKCEIFTNSIRGLLGDSISLPAKTPPNAMEEFWELDPYADDDKETLAFLEADLVDAAGKPFAQHSLADSLINAEVLLPHDDGKALARVVKCVVGTDGGLIGEYSENPLLNLLIYKCEFDDGIVKEYAANTIASTSFRSRMQMDSPPQSCITLLTTRVQRRRLR